MLYALFLYPKLREEMVVLDYVIRNNTGIYIQLDKDGRPVTCVESCKGRFEYNKANNICNSLPKALKRMKFRVEKDFTTHVNKNKVEINKDSPNREPYELSDNIRRWVDIFGECDDKLNQAKEREKELLQLLRKYDDELLDILHIIEIEKPKDMFKGWQIYKHIRDSRRKRREAKDELIIIENVLDELTDISCLHREKVQKAIDGLFNRTYRYRIVEEDEENESL